MDGVFFFTVYQFSETPIFEEINQNKALFVITPWSLKHFDLIRVRVGYDV